MHQIHRFNRKGQTEAGRTGPSDTSDVSIRVLKNRTRSFLTPVFGCHIKYYSGEGCSLCDLYSLLNNGYGSVNRNMTELTTDSERELQAYKDALNAAGTDYTVRTVHKINVGAEDDSDDPDDDTTVRDDLPLDKLPTEGTRARELIEFVAQHPRKWVRGKDLPDRFQNPTGTYLPTIKRDYGVFETKRLSGKGGVDGYRLKEPYRRELTGQSVDVEALQAVQNA